jgi:hypothetical protein
VATGFPSVSFLDPNPDGGITIHSGGPVAMIDPAGKVAKMDVLSTPSNQKSNSVASFKPGVNYWISGTQYSFGNGKKTTLLDFKGPTAPTCIVLWPDHGHLVIGEADGAYLWAVRIEKDGSFGPGDRYYSLRTVPNEKMHVTAMAIQEVNAGYLLFACTPLGVQVFDPTGRLCGVIAAPSKEPMTAIAIGGPNADTLFVASGDKVYTRKIQAKRPAPKKKGK